MDIDPNVNNNPITASPASPSVVFEGGPAAIVETTEPKSMSQQLAEFQQGGRAKPAELPKTDPASTVYVGDKPYNMKELVKEVLKENQGVTEKVPAEAPPAEEDISEMMFTDPKGYTQRLEDRAAARIERKIADEKRSQSVQSKFYTENKDLVEHVGLVRMFAKEMGPALAKEDEAVALSKVAQAVRAEVARIKGAVATPETLQSRPAVTAGATGNPTVRAAQAEKPPEDFISQMKTAFKRGKARY